MTDEKKTSSVMRQIDENLRRVYMDQQDDDIPDRFKSLLQKLKEQDKGEAGTGSDD
ncbi:hypothetical protein PARPLA_00225 [Rhodobacteraceae bacterium THAF1]|uniref:NepR family anti-sigma factor n=1 Tax=Palleronia sp. THAF1 TaxID=2587842 RepID=UPI000F3ACFD1|nr:NepR family anti-sigma factor [Palleronia sp. THAF1]QFU10210.1 hypothetical protein FIU81_16135 [Palleronia sp. THAF1]VDC16885.1 hypothetical protein PARPLA_00225 [Rhodobacteraceae bacterium THAF1]